MDETQRAVDRALRALAVRAHSEQEIVDKLVRAGFDERVIAEAMARLASYDYVNDRAFAAQWASARARKGMGPWRIQQELRAKGVGAEAVEAVLEGYDEDQALAQAAALAEKHLRRGDGNARKRAFDALVRRGHGYALARKAVALAEEGLAQEADEQDPYGE